MFDQFYHQSSDQLKLSFLEEAFRKYPDLKEDFLTFYLKPTDTPMKMTVSDPDDFMLASTDLIRADLESININEPDWENYVPRHSGYISDCEATEHLAEDEIGRIIGVNVGEVERYCAGKHFDLAFLYMISMYQACTEAKLDDEYGMLPDATHIMLNELEYRLNDYMPLFKAIQLSVNHIFTIATVFFVIFRNTFGIIPGF